MALFTIGNSVNDHQKTENEIAIMSEELVNSLKKEVDVLKKKLGAAAIIGLLLGGGGLFGVVKYIATDGKLTIAETRLKTVESEVMKLNALTTIYEREKDKLNTAQIDNLPQESIEKIKIRVEELEKNILDTEKDLNSAILDPIPDEMVDA